MTCPFCGKADNPARARFCSHCGTALLPSRAVVPDQPSNRSPHLDEPIQTDPDGEAAGLSGLPGRSRHGFYAGQISHLDQAGAAPLHPERTDDARRAEEIQPGDGHFDERYGTGGRFVSREAAPPAQAEVPVSPEPMPDLARRPAITPEMVFWFGQSDPAPVNVSPPVESRPAPVRAAGAPEPDPVSRSFGTWETPPAPAPRPDLVVAARQEQQARDARAEASAQLDLATVRDLFPEPPRESTAGGEPGTPAAPPAPVPPIPAGTEPAQAVDEGRRELDGAPTRAKDEPTVAPSVASTTASRSPDGVGPAAPDPATRPAAEREGTAGDVGPAMSRGDSGHGGGPAGPIGQVGPWSATAGTGGERTGAPLTKQSRYWATGAHASAFVGAWMGGVPAFIGPLVVWLARKDDDPFAAEHGRNALNFNLSVIVYVLGLIIVSILTFGIGLLVTIPGFIALGLAWFAFTLVGTIKAASSESYRYPLTIRFVR